MKKSISYSTSLEFAKIIKYYFPIVLLGILVAVSFQESLLEQIEKDLSGHMILEHPLFFLLGALSVIVAERFLKLLVSTQRKGSNAVYRSNGRGQDERYHLRTMLITYWSKFLRGIFSANRYGLFWVAITVILMTFWHTPWVFDFASLHDATHILQHLSFVIVGAAGFLAMRALGESFNLFLLLSLIGMMGFLGLIFSLSDDQIYTVYSLESHNRAGTFMIILSLLILIIALPVYLIKRTLFHVSASGRENEQNLQS